MVGRQVSAGGRRFGSLKNEAGADDQSGSVAIRAIVIVAEALAAGHRCMERQATDLLAKTDAPIIL